MTTPTVAVVGVNGHGRSHVRAALERHARGTARLIAVADPNPPADGALGDTGARHHTDVHALLAEDAPDVVVISTPIHTHADLAAAALRAGSDVLLEKPPAATLEEYAALHAVADETGGLVQIGFQSLGSDAVGYIRGRIAEGRIGDVVRVGAAGAWVRPESYFTRTPWAGKRRIGDRVVADGVLTNPLAHATATALALVERAGAGDVLAVTPDLHRVNDIAADDTSVARLRLRDAPDLTTAVSLCAAEREEPYVEVIGERGGIRFYYSIDIVQEWRGDDPPFTTRHGRTDLVEDLLRARREGSPLAASLTDSGGFMRMLDAVTSADDPHVIGSQWFDRVTDAAGTHRVLRGVEGAIHDAVRSGRTFRELGAPWAV